MLRRSAMQAPQPGRDDTARLRRIPNRRPCRERKRHCLPGGGAARPRGSTRVDTGRTQGTTPSWSPCATRSARRASRTRPRWSRRWSGCRACRCGAREARRCLVDPRVALLRPPAPARAGRAGAAPIERDVLIGRATFVDAARRRVNIVDWRHAPVSQLYYRYAEGSDYEETLRRARRRGRDPRAPHA